EENNNNNNEDNVDEEQPQLDEEDEQKGKKKKKKGKKVREFAQTSRRSGSVLLQSTDSPSTKMIPPPVPKRPLISPAASPQASSAPNRAYERILVIIVSFFDTNHCLGTCNLLRKML
ncbi:MAG: hypothetical protein IIW17_09620, partial [Clostridia bacterium]|nr:hypothetical protein [Clostridia bacterium]